MLCFHAVVQVIAYTCDPSWFGGATFAENLCSMSEFKAFKGYQSGDN
jgi:hypothetical protein